MSYEELIVGGSKIMPGTVRQVARELRGKVTDVYKAQDRIAMALEYIAYWSEAMEKEVEALRASAAPAQKGTP